MDIDAEIKKSLTKQRRKISKAAKEATERVDIHTDRLAAEFEARHPIPPVKVKDLK